MTTTFEDLFAFINALGDDYHAFTASRHPPDEAAIAATEVQLGFALAPDHRAFVARYGALCLEVIDEVWPRPQAFEIRPHWQMCWGLWVHGIADHRDLSLIAQRRPGFAPVLRIAGPGLGEAIGYDDAGGLVRWTELGLVPAGGTVAAHAVAAARQLASDRERLRTEPIAPPSPPPTLRPTVTLKLQAAPDAVPSALRRARHELGGTWRVEVRDDDGEAHPAELDAFATRTDDVILNVVIDGRELDVVALTPPALAVEPLTVFIQSVAHPNTDPVAAGAIDALERALAATGIVIERSTNF